MAKSAENLCNMALAHLGLRGSNIDSLETDQTEAAEVCNTFYATARDFALVAFPWPFAGARATLAELENEDREGWAHVFALPADCLMPKKIFPVGSVLRTPTAEQRYPFVLEKASDGDGQVLLCDVEIPVLFYTARIEDVTKMSAPFELAMSYKLSELICLSLTGDVSKKKTMAQQFYLASDEAATLHMNGQQEDQPPETSTLAARR